MEERKQTVIHKTVKSGITFGSALAMVISYSTWHSVGWAVPGIPWAGPFSMAC